jgi:hypothetical protein
MTNPNMFGQSGVRYLALLIKDNAVPIDECFCQFASIHTVTEGLESIKISEDAFLEVTAYLLGDFLDAPARQKLFQFMDMDRDSFLGIQDWRKALAFAEYWMSEDGKKAFAAIRIQSAWRGHFERSALTLPASGMFTIESVFEPPSLHMPRIVLDTDVGSISLVLLPNTSPATCAHVARHVKEGLYRPPPLLLLQPFKPPPQCRRHFTEPAHASSSLHPLV